MTLVDALNLLTAVFGLLAAVATLVAVRRKPKPLPRSRSPYVVPIALFLLAGSALIARQVIQGPQREVTIATPARDVTITMKREGDEHSYLFAATGSCPECTADERVQLMVLPPQGGLWIPQRAVTVTNGRWRLSTVYLGNKDNPVRERDVITLQAVVVQERNRVEERQRLESPLDVDERGVSLVHEITVVKVEPPVNPP